MKMNILRVAIAMREIPRDENNNPIFIEKTFLFIVYFLSLKLMVTLCYIY